MSRTDYTTTLDEVLAVLANVEHRDIPDIADAYAARELETVAAPTNEGEARAALSIAFTAGMMAARQQAATRRWWDLTDD